MKLSAYLSVAMMAVLAVLTACDGKNEPEYSPSDPAASGQRVFFASPTVQLNVGDDAESVAVKLYRPQDDAAPALTVQILSTDESGLFRIPSTVEFAAGQIATDITIGFVNSALVPNQNYTVNLTINEANANQYAVTSTAAVICHSVWSEWEPFGYDEALGRDGQGYYVYSLLFNEPETVNPVLVLSRTNPLDPKQMQFEVQQLIDPDDESKGWETFLTFSSNDGGTTLTVSEQESMEGPDGMIYVEDLFSYSGSAEYKGKSTFDPVSGTFRLNLIYFDEVGPWNFGFETLQLNGYVDTNTYTLNVADHGSIKVDGKDYQIINFDFNANINYVLYTLIAGQLDDEQVAEVAAKISEPGNTDYKTSKVEKTGNITLDFPRSGEYTVVAVGFHLTAAGEAEPKATASAYFNYVNTDPDAGWTQLTSDGSMTEDLLNALFELGIPETVTNVRVDQSEDFEGIYRINSPYANYAYLDALADAGITLSPDFASIIINAGQSEKIYVEPSFTGFVYNSQKIWLESTAAYYLAQDVEPSDDYFGVRTANGFEFKALPMANDDDDSSFLVSLDGTNFGYLANMSLTLDMAVAPAGIASRHNALKSLRLSAPVRKTTPASVTYGVRELHLASGRYCMRAIPRFIY